MNQFPDSGGEAVAEQRLFDQDRTRFGRSLAHGASWVAGDNYRRAGLAALPQQGQQRQPVDPGKPEVEYQAGVPRQLGTRHHSFAALKRIDRESFKFE